MEKDKINGYVLTSKATLDSKTLPDSTTCTLLAEKSGEVVKGKNQLMHILIIILA